MKNNIENNIQLTPGEHFPSYLTPPTAEEILSLLGEYGISSSGEYIHLIDSSQDPETDLRLNYIIDKRFVLRLHRAPDLTEERLGNLARLVDRYKEFGLQCPAFLPDEKGIFLHSRGPLSVYLTEYIDLPLMDVLIKENPKSIDEDAFWQEVTDSVALFAQRYKNVDLMETRGMYSLFDLAPFDKEEGIDEKQQNFNQLMKTLKGMGEEALAEKLLVRHEEIRSRLKAVYKDLPQCVFQADENYSNVLVGPDGHLAGFIDFNLAGTEVIVNQLANLGGGFQEELKEPIGAKNRLERTMEEYRQYQDRLLSLYQATDLEKQAMEWYNWIALISGWPQLCFFKEGLKNEALKEEILELLALLADL